MAHLSMEFGLVIGTIKKGIKSTIWMHILIFNISFQEKLKIISYVQWFLHNFSHFTSKILNAPTARVQTWLKNVSNIMYFKKKQVCKIPPRGEHTCL